MSVDIITGNIWGLWTSEWDLAPKRATQLLKFGMVTIIVALGQSLSVEKAADSDEYARIFQNSSMIYRDS